MLEDKATEIKKENNTKMCSVCNEVSLSESSEVCFGRRERVGADSLWVGWSLPFQAAVGFVVSWQTGSCPEGYT